MKAYGYVRVSSKGQVEGDGFDRQRTTIQEFCKANGLSCIGCRQEEGVSGNIEAMDRPAFSNLVQDISDQVEMPVIVVERMDRLARDLMVQEFLLRECRSRGIKVFAADQGLIDLTDEDIDPTRKLIRQVLGALAEWEKSALVKKLRAARTRAKAANGGKCEGAKPFGFYPNEKQALELIKTMSGHYSSAQIATYLNHEDLKPRTAEQWTPALVLNVISKLGRKETVNA